MKEIIEWQRTLTCNPNATIDIALPTGKYSLSAGLSVIAPGPGPDIERYCRYTRNMDVDIKAGEISRIALPIGNQSDWEMKHSESHRVGETQPATAPADQASTVGP